MVDRKTRHLLAKKTDHMRVLSVNQSMGHLMDTLPQKIFKTMTPGCGSGFTRRDGITNDRPVLCYFLGGMRLGSETLVKILMVYYVNTRRRNEI